MLSRAEQYSARDTGRVIKWNKILGSFPRVPLAKVHLYIIFSSVYVRFGTNTLFLTILLTLCLCYSASYVRLTNLVLKCILQAILSRAPWCYFIISKIVEKKTQNVNARNKVLCFIPKRREWAAKNIAMSLKKKFYNVREFINLR